MLFQLDFSQPNTKEHFSFHRSHQSHFLPLKTRRPPCLRAGHSSRILSSLRERTRHGKPDLDESEFHFISPRTCSPEQQAIESGVSLSCKQNRLP